MVGASGPEASVHRHRDRPVLLPCFFFFCRSDLDHGAHSAGYGTAVDCDMTSFFLNAEWNKKAAAVNGRLRNQNRETATAVADAHANEVSRLIVSVFAWQRLAPRLGPATSGTPTPQWTNVRPLRSPRRPSDNDCAMQRTLASALKNNKPCCGCSQIRSWYVNRSVRAGEWTEQIETTAPFNCPDPDCALWLHDA